MTRTSRTLAAAATAALALGIPAAVVLGTAATASACALVAAHGALPQGCGIGGGESFAVAAAPSTAGPGAPITLTMTETVAAGSSDVTAHTTFAMNGGTCTGAVCSSYTPGTHTVSAHYSNLADSGTATTTVTVLAPDHLVLSPAQVTASSGQAVAYTVTAAAADGTVLGDVTPAVTVTLDGAACPGAVCTAAAAGDHAVTATGFGLTAGGVLTVRAGAPASLVVTPHVAYDTWSISQPADFTVEAYDAAGNEAGYVTAQSSLTIAPDGTCSAGSCTPVTSGSHTVTATYGALTGRVTLDATGGIPTVAPDLPAGTVGTAYSTSVLTYGDATTRVTAGGPVPPGLTLTSDGTLSGVPTTAGTYQFFVLALDDNGGVNAPTTITIAPGPPSQPSVSIRSASMPEGNSGLTTVSVAVRLSAASGTPVTVSWHTADGTAVAGTDYVSAHGTVTIPAGRLSAKVTVSVLGDTVPEQNEKFAVVLTAPQHATLGTARGTVTITNDD